MCKLTTTMKKHIIFIVLALMSFSSIIAQDYAFAQKRNLANAQVFSVTSDEISLSQALTLIEKRKGVAFVYLDQDVQGKTLQAQVNLDQEIEYLLDQILPQMSLDYESLRYNTYRIFASTTPKNQSPISVRPIKQYEQMRFKDEGDKIMYVRLNEVTTNFQTPVLAFEVSGTVYDASGNPLTGATVRVKGQTTGTLTNDEGRYELTIDDGNQTLIISYIGYITREIPVNSRNQIDVTLEEDVSSLEEVVVVGYGQQKKGSVTGAVASVGVEEITSLPVPSFAEAIQGRLPGVLVTSDGGPGVSPIVRIRGIGSISFASDPLYVVDGYPIGGLNDFDNYDIESISVLKDASAAAIYGSRAANGVVLVTTKRGQASERLRITYNGYVGFDQEANRIDLLNREQYLDYGSTLLGNAGDAFPDRWDNLNEPIFEGANQTYAETDVDYQDAIFQTGLNTAHNVSLSGGNQYSTFYSSVGYFEREGIMLGTKFDRFNVRLNSDHKFAERFKIGQTLTIINTDRENEQQGGGRTQIQNVIRGIPYIPIEDPTLPGGYRAPDNSDGSDPENPVRVALLDRSFDRGVRIFGSAYAGIEIIEGLEYKFVAGVNWDYSRGRQILPIYFDGFSGREFLELRDRRFVSLGTYYSNQLSFNRSFGNHNLDVVAVAERQDASFDEIDGRGLRPTNDLTIIGDVENPTIGGNIGENTLFSFAGRVNYDFGGRYLLSASFRRDGSSKFAEGNKWGNFPGFSAGWVITEEPFMDNVNFLSSLKLRGSWGELGFEGIGNYESQAGISNNTTAVFGDNVVRGVFFDRLANRELEWETTTMTNVGLDAGFFNNRWQISAEWYERTTDNLILGVPQPLSQGYEESTIANIGGIENWGVEFQSIYFSDFNKEFQWDVTVNFAVFRNEVTALATETATIFAGSNADFGGFDITRTTAGDPIQAFFGWEVEGIFQNQAQIDEYNARNSETPYQAEAVPGDLIFRDLDGDGTITPEDRTVIGSFIPDFTYGININAAYKNFYIKMFWNGVQGNDVYNATKVLTEGGLRLFNAGTAVLDAWTPENTDTNIPRMVNGDPNQNTRTSDRFIEDGSFLRLQTLRIGYDFPTNMLSGISNGFIRDLNIYVSGANLLTITDYTGYDPEIGSRGAGSNSLLVNGIDYGQYPRARTILMGLRIGL